MSPGAQFARFALTLGLALVLQMVQLPDAISGVRPLWLALTLGYWALFAPEQPVIFAAWICGFCCDVLYHAPLGQYALGLVTVAFAVRRMRGLLLVFPIWQSMLALAPVWAGYTFMMFWIDGLNQHQSSASLRWLPVLTTTLLWPLAVGLLGTLRNRRGRRAGLA